MKEFYRNLLSWDVETMFLRGKQVDTYTQALEALLQLPHIPPSRDAYKKIKVDIIKGELPLDLVLKKIGRPDV
ncbi:hypothetical protein AHAS_Ahas20G0186400 [Arachis hypogaea]